MDFPGEKLVIKLWETLTDKGVGSLLTPWKIRRDGKARNEIRRDEVLMLAQAEADAADIRAGRARLLDDGTLQRLPSPARNAEVSEFALVPRIEPQFGISSAVSAAERTQASEAARHEINTAKAVLYAEERLAGDLQQPPDREVGEDWIFAWRESAGRVSNEDLQRLWGSVLAGEVKSPGRYSMRTLDFLRALSKEEADALCRLAKFAFGDFVVRSQKTYLESQGLSFGLLLKLQELGVLSGVDALGLNKKFRSQVRGRFMTVLVCHNKILLVEADDESLPLDINVYALTDVGSQVLSLGAFEPDEQYLQAVGKEIASKGFRVSLADWRPLTENEGQYSNLKPIIA